MHFSFHSPCSKYQCQQILRSAPDVELRSGKFFSGESKEDTFQFNYAIKHSERLGSTQTTKTLPYCTIKGKIITENLGHKIEGSITIVKARTIIISIIFALVFIGIETVLYLNHGPFLKLGFFLLMAYFAFFFSEFMRFHSSKNEALEEFKNLFQK